MVSRFLTITAMAAALSLPVGADVVRAAPDGFQIHLVRSSDLPSNLQYARMADLAAWWSPSHTYSGDAENLSLSSVSPGGQWLETWDGGEVRHGEVIAVLHQGGNHMVRFDASLGPLQGIGVEAVLTVSISADGAGSEVTMDYFVTGAGFQALNDIAPIVDGVLTEQIDRLVDP